MVVGISSQAKVCFSDTSPKAVWVDRQGSWTVARLSWVDAGRRDRRERIRRLLGSEHSSVSLPLEGQLKFVQ